MYKLEFTLKQHTPIIHFQYDQEGATLRATEVKPKLDRFIFQKIFPDLKPGITESLLLDKIKENIEIYKCLIGDKSKPALNYSLFLNASEKNLEVSRPIESKYINHNRFPLVEKFPCFFGLMGEANSSSKEFVFHNLIKLSIQTSLEKLREIINDHIVEFFSKNCFGNRQSKGFGSFTINGSNNQISNHYKYWFDIDLNTIPNERYTYDAKRSLQFRKQFYVFDRINLLYSTLRSGLNQMGGLEKIYFKSLLFSYFMEKQVQWDKKTIKEKFYFNSLKKQRDHHDNPDILSFSVPDDKKLLVRDLLGLASDSQWKDYPSRGFTNTIKKEYISKEKDFMIDRFKSPLFFKPIEINQNLFTVYLGVDYSQVANFFDKEFKISIDKSDKSFKIKTPKSFDYDEFLRFAFNKDVRSHAQLKDGTRSSKDLDFLESTFEQIIDNLKK